MRKVQSNRPAAQQAGVGFLCLAVSILFIHSALGETPFGMGSPSTVSRRGVPLDPGEVAKDEESSRGRFPFQPLDRDPTEGIRHGFVQTTSGRFGFEVIDLRLPGRVPLTVGRVYDAGILAALPGVPFGGEPRTSEDLGPNWLLKPTSVMIPVPSGFMLLTDEGGAVPYVLDAGTGKYYPTPSRPQEYSVLESDGQGGYRMILSNGMVRFYQQVTMANNYWLVREEDPSGNALVFTYDQGYLKRIDGTDGSWILIHRRMFGDSAPPNLPQARIVQITDSAGRSLSFTYDSEFKLATFTDAGGGVWTNTWDTNNHITQHTDPLDRTVFAVSTDANHRATSVAVGGVGVTYNYQTGQTVVTDGRGNNWNYQFNTGGMTTQVTDPENGITQLVRDSQTGDLTQVIDPEGGVHLFQHDARHRLTRLEGPAVNGVAPVWTFQRNSKGILLRMVAPNGAATEFAYSTQPGITRWLTGEGSDPDADGTVEAWTTYTRAANGDITRVTDPAPEANPTYTDYVYNAQGLLTEVHPPCLENGTICPVIRYEYDAAGNLTKIRWPRGPEVYSDWVFTWSPLGIRTSVTDPLNHTRQYQLDAVGSVVQKILPNGGIWKYFWRADGKPERVEDPLGNSTLWTYGLSGEITKVTDQAGEEWAYTWDGMGRLEWRTDPEGRTWKNRYDHLGRLIEQETPGGRKINNTYDALGRVTLRTLPGDVEEFFTWNLVGQPLTLEKHTPDGEATIIDRWTYTWDGRGLPLTLLQQSDLGGWWAETSSLSWTWNNASRLVGFTDGNTVNSQPVSWTVIRDSWGRAIELVPSSGSSSTLQYEPWSGWLSRREYGSFSGASEGFEELFSRDALGRTIELIERNEVFTRTHYSYVRDAMGEVAQAIDLKNGPPGITSDIFRDPLGHVVELTSQNGDRQILRWSRRGEWIADSRANAQGAFSETLYTYDRAGLPIGKNDGGWVTSFQWNFLPDHAGSALEVMRSVSGSGGEENTRLTFDSEGRIEKVERNDEIGWTLQRSFRWIPGGLPWAVFRFQEQYPAIASRETFATGLNGPQGSLPSTGALFWYSPAFDLLEAGEVGLWNLMRVGRLDSQVDDGRLFRPSAGWSIQDYEREAGGLGAKAGINLPIPRLKATQIGTRDVMTTSDQESVAHFPDPKFEDEAMGLPTLPFKVPGSNASTNRPQAIPGDPGTWDELCSAHVIRLNTFEELSCAKRGLPVRFVCFPITQSLDTCDLQWLPSGVHSQGRPGVQHWYPRTPTFNPDRHPLGVILSTGEYTLSITDMEIEGRGLNLALTRSYRSGFGEARGVLGQAWTLGLFGEYLEIDSQTNEVAGWHDSEGQLNEIKYVGRIRKGTTNGVDWYRLRQWDGTIRKFEKVAEMGPMRLVRVGRPGATPITVEYQNWGSDLGVQPYKAILWSCDNDPETNPISAGECTQPQEIGHFQVDSWYQDWTIKKISEHIAGSTSARWVEYSYWHPGPKEDGSSIFLQKVKVGEGTTSKDVAEYHWAGEFLPPAYDPYDSCSYVDCSSVMHDDIVQIKDGSGKTSLALQYFSERRNPDGGLNQYDRDAVATILVGPTSEPEFCCGSIKSPSQLNPAHSAWFSYSQLPGGTGEEVKVGEGGGITRYMVGTNGKASSVFRPDGKEYKYQYDTNMRMTRAEDPAGGLTEYLYQDRAGTVMSAPERIKEIPSTTLQGEQVKITCFRNDPVTGGSYMVLPPGGVNPADPDPCQFESNNLFKPEAEETVFGWMAACDPPSSDFDNSVNSYLQRWSIVPASGDPPLPFRCDSTLQTSAWLSPVKTIGAAPGLQFSETTGNFVETGIADRPMTRYFYTSQGSLKRILHPNQTIETTHRLGLGEFGPAEGGEGGLGRIAQTKVEDSVGTLLSLTRLGYDQYGNVKQTWRLMEGDPASGPWLVTEREFDLQNRLTREREQTHEYPSGPWKETKFQWDGAGRLLKKRIDTTENPGWSSRSAALVAYTYTTGNMVESEIAWEIASAGDDIWAGSGESTERRWIYDGFGKVLQEAVRLSGTGNNSLWRINRTSYDLLQRPVVVQAFAAPYEGTAPPANETPIGGNRTEQRSWYQSTGNGLLEWEQFQGVEASPDATVLTRIAAKTIRHTWDGHEREMETWECGSATLGSDPDASGNQHPPICNSGGWLNRNQTWYTVEDQPQKAQVFQYPQDNGGGTLAGWSETDYDRRGRVVENRVAAFALDSSPSTCGIDGTCTWIRTRTKYDLMDRAVTVASPNSAGATMVFSKAEYDGMGRRTKTVDPLLNTVEITRNTLGLPITKKETEISGPGPHLDPALKVAFEYDGLGRAKAVAFPNPEDSAHPRKLVRTLDVRGNVTAQWTPLGSAAPGDAYKSEAKYDGLGRKISERKHLGASNDYTDGWQDVEYQWDDGGRLIQIVVEPHSKVDEVKNQITQYEYDAQGRQTKRILPGDTSGEQTAEGTRYRFEFDSAGRLKAMVAADKDGTCNSSDHPCVTRGNNYNEAGRLESLTVTIQGNSDFLTHYGGTTAQSWVYDGLGRITRATDTNGDATAVVVKWVYDSLGRTVKEEFLKPGTADEWWTVSSEFDKAGRRKNVQYPLARNGETTPSKLVYNWDDLGRLMALAEEEGDGTRNLAQYTYNGASRMTGITYADGSIWSAAQWDSAGRRLTGIVTGGAVELFSEAIGFDADNRVKHVVWAHGRSDGPNGEQISEAQIYDYDDQARLVQFKEGLWNAGSQDIDGTAVAYHDFQLDEMGNWKKHHDGAATGPDLKPGLDKVNAYQTWKVNAGTSGTQGIDFKYDRVMGFLWERELRNHEKLHYQHDGLGRLVAVQKGTDALVRYGYDALGRLAWRQVGEAEDSRVWLVYDGSQAIQEILKSLATSNFIVDKEYTWSGSQLERSWDASGHEVFLHRDRMGSIVLATRLDGSTTGMAGHAAYDPYGRPIDLPAWDSNDLPVLFGFAGARFDPEAGREDLNGDGTVGSQETTGLYLMGARWYDPELGRFLETDPIGETGGLNLYNYVGSSPTLWVDPSGLKPINQFSKEMWWYHGKFGDVWTKAPNRGGPGYGFNSYRTTSKNVTTQTTYHRVVDNCGTVVAAWAITEIISNQGATEISSLGNNFNSVAAGNSYGPNGECGDSLSAGEGESKSQAGTPGTQNQSANKQLQLVSKPGTPTAVPMKDDKGNFVIGASGEKAFMPEGWTIQNFAEFGAIAAGNGLGFSLGMLASFRIGGPWDLQRLGGDGVQITDKKFIDAATIAIGVYSASAGIPYDVVMTIMDQYAARRSNFGDAKRDSTFTHLPERNVNNTRIGYNLVESGRVRAQPVMIAPPPWYGPHL